MPKGDEPISDAPMETNHVTVTQLVKDYYTNQSQKDEVNGYVNNLKPAADYHNQD